MQPEPRPVKGLLAKFVRAIGVEPTESVLFNVRLAIVVIGILIMGYTYITYDDAGKKYGNYDEIQHKLPQ